MDLSNLTIFGTTVSPWLVIPVIFFFWVTVLLFIKSNLFKTIKRVVNKTQTKVDDIVIHALDFPLTLLIFTSGGAIIEQLIPRGPDVEFTNYFLIGFKATTILAVVLFIDRLCNGLILEYSQKVDVLKTSSGVARGLVRAIVIGLGLLILLDSFGVSITPFLASLGIGSLAVALALQPTLENFFSGMQLVIDKPVKVGQFVKIDSGEEGYVHKIGWRSTWIRLLANNMVVIPNKTLVDSKIINYYYPERELSVLVQVGVHYDSDLEHVERVTMEVGKEVLQSLEAGIKTFEPFIRYHTFDAYSINFSVILRVQEFVDGYLIKHEFIKKLHQRYAKEGIVIPYPIRAINYHQEGGENV